MSRYYVRKGVHYGTADQMIDYIDDLEAKLAKAGEALEMMLCRYMLYCGGDAMPHAGHTDRGMVAIVTATLAELKGEKDA